MSDHPTSEPRPNTTAELSQCTRPIGGDITLAYCAKCGCKLSTACPDHNAADAELEALRDERDRLAARVHELEETAR